MTINCPENWLFSIFLKMLKKQTKKKEKKSESIFNHLENGRKI